MFGVESNHVIQAESGNVTLEMIESSSIDLIITDLRMPNGNGLKVRDKAVDCGIPVILASAYSQAYGTFIGRDELVFKKPILFDALLNAIDDICDRRQHLPIVDESARA